MPWAHHVCGMWWSPLLSTSPDPPPLSLPCKVCKGVQVLDDMSPQWFSSTWVGSKHLYPCSFRLFRSCLWMAFWIIQISVCISRVFIATHFPHQVILGLFAGEFFSLYQNISIFYCVGIFSLTVLFWCRYAGCRGIWPHPLSLQCKL